MIELIFGIIIIFGILYTLQMMLCTEIQMRKFYPSESSINFPAVTILKPLKGIDDNLEDNLRSFFKLDYPEFEILFGINSQDDPAVEIVKKLMKKQSHIKSKLVITSR